MAEDNLQPQKPQAQNNAPDNLPGIEVTSLDEITQLINQKLPRHNRIRLSSKSSQTDANTQVLKGC